MGWSLSAALADPPVLSIAAEEVVKYNIAEPYCAIARDPVVSTVAVPAVTVVMPAPIFCRDTVSPAANSDVLTVMVVALPLFITTVVPASAATRT